MDTTCHQTRTLRISIPATSQPSRSSLSTIAAFARGIGVIFASLNVNLGRKTTIVPGMSDRAFAQASRTQHIEDAMRSNAIAHKYGGTRIRL